MVELVKYIARSLVENPDAVDVREVESEEGITIELRVAEDDMVKVIGKQGRIAKAIRTVVKAAFAKSEKPVFESRVGCAERTLRGDILIVGDAVAVCVFVTV